MARLSRFLGNLFGSNETSTPPARIRKTPLGLHTLEAREVPAVFMDGTVMTATGTGSNEIVLVTRLGENTATTADDQIRITRHLGVLSPPIESLTRHVSQVSSIRVDLYGGNDTFLNHTDMISIVNGGSGNDILRGGSGTDFLYGDGNHDQIFGNAGNDYLYGGSGNDRLYGGSGTDMLWGESGTNGLYGGYDLDFLYGGSGSDRFLLGEAGDVIGSGYNSSLDAIIRFENSDSNITANFGDGPSVFDNQNWTQTDIERVDSGLALLHEPIGNATFLKYDGDDIQFRRTGEHLSGDGSGVLGWNGDTGVVTLTQGAFSGTDHRLRHVVVHEVGHNWDESDENPTIGAFRNISSWNDPIFGQIPNTGYTLNSKGNWSYKANTEFASDYARTNPKEDFAESFALFFLNSNNEGLAVGSNLRTFGQMPLKMASMQTFVNTVS